MNVNIKPDYGIHKAIVIDSFDKEVPQSGRVQVYVPDVHSAALNAIFKDSNSSVFRFMGAGIETSLTPDVIAYLKSFCPWAVPIQPIMTDYGMGSYNASTGGASISENNCIGDGNVPNQASNFDTEPAAINIISPYGNNQQHFTANADVNPTGRTPSLSNLSKGIWTIPRVGSALAVVFFDGNINYPAYIGGLADMRQYQEIFESVGINMADGQTSPLP